MSKTLPLWKWAESQKASRKVLQILMLPQKFGNQTSRGSETELAEVRDANANYNNTNYTDLSYNNQSNQSESKVEETIDVMDDVNAYIEIIKENIEYEHYMKYSTQVKGLYDELFEVICEVVCVKH